MIMSIMSLLDSRFQEKDREHIAIKDRPLTHCYGCGAGQIQSSPVLLSGSIETLLYELLLFELQLVKDSKRAL